jgi:hypothetical protein
MRLTNTPTVAMYPILKSLHLIERRYRSASYELGCIAAKTSQNDSVQPDNPATRSGASQLAWRCSLILPIAGSPALTVEATGLSASDRSNTRGARSCASQERKGRRPPQLTHQKRSICGNRTRDGVPQAPFGSTKLPQLPNAGRSLRLTKPVAAQRDRRRKLLTVTLSTDSGAQSHPQPNTRSCRAKCVRLASSSSPLFGLG